MPPETPAESRPPEPGVIRGKVRPPPLPERYAARPRVEELLADLIERHRVITVSATAGAGKTTAVATAVERLERRLAWLTLDWTDAAPGRLVTYLEAALARPLPQLAGTATRALSARVPHPEAAGLLVEAAGCEPVVLVIDEIERIGDSTDAAAVIESVLRYAPREMHTVLVGRREIPAALLGHDVAEIGDTELAFTPPEAAVALAALGHTAVDAEAAVRATGGWVTGVLFEAWHYREHVAGAGGAADPLHGYLSAHIVEQLSDPDRDFLITTSVLDEVTASRAIALGLADAAKRLAQLRSLRLPVTWHDRGRVLRCHPRFREYLRERLEERGADHVSAVRLAHGRLLVGEGRDEEAIEELLAARAPQEALAPAARAIFGVIDRLDLGLAERWLGALRAVAPKGPSPLVMAELMLALAVEDFRRGAALADALGPARSHITGASSAAALMIALCYAMAGRVDDVEAVYAEAPRDAEFEVLRYFMTIFSTDPPPPRPALTGGPLDALVLATSYGYGRLAELLAEPAGGWVRAWTQPWLISALSDSGRTAEALELYDEVRAHGFTGSSLDSVVGPHALVDGGRREEALAAIERGRRAARAGGSLVYGLLAGLSEARLRLRLDRDPVAARRALDRLEEEPLARRLGYLAEQIDAWYGFALLLQGDDVAARERLRRAVETMLRSERFIELPTAAVYLAEAEWRAGDEPAADRAADIALHAARVQGSNHMLLKALADFPSVASRRLDAEPAAESPWHELGRALVAQGAAVSVPVRAAVRLEDFGSSRILVNDEEVRPRIAKTYELLAYLTAGPAPEAERDELLDALFDGRTDPSTRAYLRQAVRWLRHVLPEGAVRVDEGRVSLSAAVPVAADSARFEAALAEAARLQGADRLAATLDALEIFERGEYLPAVASQWAEDRRRRLSELATDARYEAAELAFAEGSLDRAVELIDQVVAADPYREAAWRLSMRLASALGDEQGVIRAYRRCQAALAEIDAVPAATTTRLLEDLRR